MTWSVLPVALSLYLIHALAGSLFALGNDPKCGVTFFEPPPGQDGHRIYHGKEVPLGKWPWMAAIVHRHGDTPQWCTGTVISNEHILTAAHCVNITKFEQNFQVIVGQLNVMSRETEGLDITSYVQHPEYIIEQEGRALKRLDNDIAVIKLATPLTFSKTVQPICLPSSFEEDTSTTKENAVIAGWGWFDEQKGESTDVLLEGTGFFVDLKECQKEISSIPLNKKMHLCENGTQTFVMGGDSGGPVFVKSGSANDQGRTRWIEVGVTSFGPSHQAPNPGGADVFARVSSYCDFINSATEGKVKCLS